jgi:hypothetical protein
LWVAEHAEGRKEGLLLVLLLFPKGGPLADRSGAPSGDRGIVRATQFHSKRQIRAKRLSLQAVGRNRLWREKRAATTIRFLLRSAANQWGPFSAMMRVIDLASGRSYGITRARPRPLLTRTRPKSCRGRKTPRDLETISVCLSVSV